MSDPSPGPDPLSGSPELFATNLLISRCIENRMDGVRLRRTEEGVRVYLEHPDRDHDEETLTDDPSRWEDVRDRFRSLTEPRPEGADELCPRTPAAEQVQSIRVEYPDPETIQLRFDYPDT